MNKIFPKLKNENLTIGILSVCGDIKDIEALEHTKEYFEQKGFNVKFSDTCYKTKNYLCGADDERVKALNSFFADDSIDIILTARGGYGAIKIIDKIDYELIKNNPKPFCGYSDITAFQLMIYKKTGLITYNAPMAYSDFARDITEYTEKSFFNVLKKMPENLNIDNPIVYYNGICNGTLWGGNLSTIQSLCGLDFIPNEPFVFVVEDINEPVYKIDKMMTQLLNIDEFKNNLVGIVLGNFTGIDNQRYFNDFWKEASSGLKIPTIGGFKFGHENDKQTFPIGVNVVLDTNAAKIFIL